MRRSIRSSVQWNVLGKLQKAVDAVSLNLWSSSLLRFSWRCKKKPGSASKSSLSARDLHTCLSEQHHYTCAFTGEDVAASMLSAADIFGELTYENVLLMILPSQASEEWLRDAVLRRGCFVARASAVANAPKASR